jgi:hypothetical protein
LKDKRVVKVDCGRWHTAVVTDDGEVYTFGSGDKGQLGHGDYKERFPSVLSSVLDLICLLFCAHHCVCYANSVQPRQVEKLKGIKITDICCGGLHTLAVTGLNLFCSFRLLSSADSFVFFFR